MVHEGPSGDRRVGREALGAALTVFHAAYAERVTWALTVVARTADVADVHVRETTIVRPRDGGGSMRVSGSHVGRVRREADGAWRIAHDASTLDGPPEPVAHAFALPDP